MNICLFNLALNRAPSCAAISCWEMSWSSTCPRVSRTALAGPFGDQLHPHRCPGCRTDTAYRKSSWNTPPCRERTQINHSCSQETKRKMPVLCRHLKTMSFKNLLAFKKGFVVATLSLGNCQSSFKSVLVYEPPSVFYNELHLMFAHFTALFYLYLYIYMHSEFLKMYV